jgi:hypothetical protein
MNARYAIPFAAAALAVAATPAGTLAQSPGPVAPTPSAIIEPSRPMMTPAAEATPAPQPSAGPQTAAPAPATAAPSSRASAAPSTNGNGNGNSGKHLGQIKKLQAGSLSTTDLRYALTHPVQEANKVRTMKTISFDKLRVYRLSSGLKTMFKLGDGNSDIPVLAEIGPGIQIAQATGLPSTNGNNSPIALIQYALANINVSNALNNVSVLNNSNVNVGVSLADVLNGNKISIGQVAGIFVNGLGVITTITK